MHENTTKILVVSRSTDLLVFQHRTSKKVFGLVWTRLLKKTPFRDMNISEVVRHTELKTSRPVVYDHPCILFEI